MCGGAAIRSHPARPWRERKITDKTTEFSRFLALDGSSRPKPLGIDSKLDPAQRSRPRATGDGSGRQLLSARLADIVIGLWRLRHSEQRRRGSRVRGRMGVGGRQNGVQIGAAACVEEGRAIGRVRKTVCRSGLAFTRLRGLVSGVLVSSAVFVE